MVTVPSDALVFFVCVLGMIVGGLLGYGIGFDRGWMAHYDSLHSAQDDATEPDPIGPKDSV